MFVVFGGIAVATQDKYAVQVPGGLALSERRGYGDWLPVAVSHPADKINQIAANPSMIDAYRTAFPATESKSPTAPRL